MRLKVQEVLSGLFVSQIRKTTKSGLIPLWSIAPTEGIFPERINLLRIISFGAGGREKWKLSI